MTIPKLFLSYSWSSLEHEEFVIKLATDLVESGVDVKLDKWDLKPGQDAYKFMEQMVTDSDIKKVAIISDKIYAEKADGRLGGVGTETQIISKEVYNQTNQEKFVAVVTEKDEQGKLCLPTYFKSRIYIDLSDESTYAENYQRLLFWIFDEPLYVKPEIGKPPEFLSKNAAIQLGTNSQFIRALDALKNHRPYALSALKEYLTLFSENLERFRISDSRQQDFDEEVIKNIESFLPYRDEYIQFLHVLLNQDAEDYREALHYFFEQLIQYFGDTRSSKLYHGKDIDNLKFIIHELFLYTIAIALKKEAFSYLETLLTEDYYFPFESKFSKEGSRMSHFGIIRPRLESLATRNHRLNLRLVDLHSELLKERCKSSGLKFQYLMEADFVLFLNSELSEHITWWPYTLIYLEHQYHPFEIFARSESKRYFERVKGFLNINDLNNLKILFDAYQSGAKHIPTLNYEELCKPVTLVGFDNLCKKP